jgi:hypothetical protein
MISLACFSRASSLTCCAFTKYCCRVCFVGCELAVRAEEELRAEGAYVASDQGQMVDGGGHQVA